ncbi:RNA-directed DNA polymerase, eukaryota, reverse transcriptase zinc-binding domain protein [Tanacetum coccineum]|uniref:RNA-directed DNA polymerase, eukaryota, reverse transcriptase zinc-binding domain protein n=1 Tax=Tanacetum coccineum TaxID=301880 RepID=A0ABQ5BVW2_9ASTR
MSDSPRGCRIMIGWNPEVVTVMVIKSTKQDIFCLLDSVKSKFGFYCTFLYAANTGRETQQLWRDLNVQSRWTSGNPWVLLGDFNVTLSVEEHSAANKQSFLTNVESEWSTPVEEYEMYKMVTKLKQLKKPLNLARIGVIEILLRNWRRRSDFIKEYVEAVQDEESLLCQQAKVEWLKEGDRNTAYFHKIVQGRKVEGTYVPMQVVKHFEQFLGTQTCAQSIAEHTGMFNPLITIHEAYLVTEMEIQTAMFEIDDYKAPGPDGYTSKGVFVSAYG